MYACHGRLQNQHKLRPFSDGVLVEVACLDTGNLFLNHKNEQPTFERSLDDERSFPVQSFEKGDSSGNPKRVVVNSTVWDQLITGLEKIRFKYAYVLLCTCGIYCIYCVSTKPKERNGELANELEDSSPATFQRAGRTR